MELTIDHRTIRARKFASQIMALIGDCVSDKAGAESRLIDAAYQVDAEIVAHIHPEPTNAHQ
jgi:hypothetical protein